MSKEIYIEEIEKFVSEFKEKESISVINLSDWNPSSEFMNKLAINIPYTFAINPISYIFSSDFDQTIKSKIINKCFIFTIQAKLQKNLPCLSNIFLDRTNMPNSTY